jgi:uncharacterized membrane protein YccC
MIAFPEKAKEPFKTALAMTIAYGIALSMNWANPYWAGYAVAFVSLSSIGQSFNKAAMRMFGTLIAVVVALMLIALFPQDRWLFMLFLSIYMGFCTYLMTGPKRQYFWNVCGFVCVIICMGSGPDPVNAFETAILRAEETGLGILVYSLVAILLWPVSSRKAFFATAGELISGQRQFCQASFALIKGGEVGQTAALKVQVLQAQTKFQQLLDAAESDTQEVREMRRYWRLFKGHATKLTETIGHCSLSFTELQALENPHPITNLDPFLDELDTRFAEIESMLIGQGPKCQPSNIDLILDMSGFQALSHFERAAVAVFQARLQELDQLTRALFETTREIGGFGQNAASPAPRATLPVLQWPDPDRMLAVVRVMLTMWLAYLVLIYVDSIPGGTSFVTMASVYGMIMAAMPQISIMMIFSPLITSVAFGCLVYIFILPHLSSFLGLGLLLFVVTFTICYLFSSPKQALGRTFGLAMFLSVATIDNQQTYSFMVVATNALMNPLLFLLLAITVHFPVNLRHEKSFLRLLERYFRSCDHLMSSMHHDVQHVETGLVRLRKAFHLREMSSIPTKLGGWAKFLDLKTLPGTNAQDVQLLLVGLQELAARIRELLEERSSLQNQHLVSELGDTARSWRLILKEAFVGLSGAPVNVDREPYRTRIDEMMNKLETRIRGTLDKSPEKEFGQDDGEKFYRLLGAYRGVSEALVGYAGSAGTIDWAPWHEERF